MAGLSLHAIQSSAIAITGLNSFGQIDLVHDQGQPCLAAGLSAVLSL